MGEIKGIARVAFHPGKLDEWKRLTEQAMEIVRTRDPGTLQYEVFFNDDESEAIVFERYRDADAALEHFANIGHLMEPLMPPPPSRAKSSVHRTRRCGHSSAATNRSSLPRGWPHTSSPCPAASLDAPIAARRSVISQPPTTPNQRSDLPTHNVV
jgi:quinol monooxygenase YgiN